MNLMRKLKFMIKKNVFVKKYQEFLKFSSEYEEFLLDQDRKDNYKSILWSVEIYDVLDNNDFAKVVRRLHALKKESSLYDVEVYYRKSILAKLKYAKVEIDHISTGLVGSIKFKNDNYIKKITISKTQINNNEIILCYSIYLRKLLKSYSELHTYIVDNFRIIKESNNFTWYIDDSLFENKRYNDILQLEYEWLRDWLQGTIEKLLYTKMGKKYKLPIVFNFNINSSDEKIISELKSPFLMTCFANEEDKKFLHIKSFPRYEGYQIYRYTIGKILKESNILKYFSRYGNEFYYYIFNNIEKAEIERRLGKYFTSLKRRVDIKDQKWLINKIRALKERKVFEWNIEDSDTWIGYKNGEKTDEKLFDYPHKTKKYLEIYEQYLDYLRAISSLNYNSIVLWVAGLTLIVSIIGVILTIVLK